MGRMGRCTRDGVEGQGGGGEAGRHSGSVLGGGGWHKALVVGSVSLWRRLLASRP